MSIHMIIQITGTAFLIALGTAEGKSTRFTRKWSKFKQLVLTYYLYLDF